MNGPPARKQKWLKAIAGTVLLSTAVLLFVYPVHDGYLRNVFLEPPSRRYSPRPKSQGPPPPPTAENFMPWRAVGEMPVVKDWDVVSANHAAAQLEEDELIIGAVLNGEARAYPLNMMTDSQREVFNDRLGGQPVAATW